MDYLIIPLMTASLAWFIAWLFIKALFMPWSQGLEKQITALKIESILPKEMIGVQIETVLPFIDAQLDHFFKAKLSEKMPIISMFIGDKTVAQLKTVFIDELKLLFPDLAQKFVQNAKDDFANNLQQKWKPILAPALLKATRKYRILAFIIGLCWGFLILTITKQF